MAPFTSSITTSAPAAGAVSPCDRVHGPGHHERVRRRALARRGRRGTAGPGGGEVRAERPAPRHRAPAPASRASRRRTQPAGARRRARGPRRHRPATREPRVLAVRGRIRTVPPGPSAPSTAVRDVRNRSSRNDVYIASLVSCSAHCSGSASLPRYHLTPNPPSVVQSGPSSRSPVRYSGRFQPGAGPETYARCQKLTAFCAWKRRCGQTSKRRPRSKIHRTSEDDATSPQESS